MDKIKQLEHNLNELKNNLGLIGGERAKIQDFQDAKYNITARITPKTWGIEIKLKKDFNPIVDDAQMEYAKNKNISDGLETLIMHVGLHEIAHWELPLGSEKGCPYDPYNHDKILEGVKRGLPEEKKQFSSDIANAFEDTIINPRCKEFNKDFSGQVLFWDNEGLRCDKEKKKKGFSPYYEAFVRINLHLFGDYEDEKLLKRHYNEGIFNPDKSKIEKAIKEVIKELNLPKNISDTTPLFDKLQWPIMAEKYARIMADLLKEKPEGRLSAYSSEDSSDAGDTKEDSGNGVEKKSSQPNGKEEIAYGRYVSGEGKSLNIETFEQLDSLYQRLAKDISIKVESITKESSMSISSLNYRVFNSENDNPSKIKFSKIFFDKSGINFAYPDQPLTIDYNNKIQRKSFPDFKMVLIDSSGSMENGISGYNSGRRNFIPWGDNSKYHWALLGYYGIENFLQKQGISPYIEHGVSSFSSTTRYKSGKYKDLIEIRKLLLSPEFGGTGIDISVLKKSLPEKGCFFLSISDGEIGDWRIIKEDFKKMIESNYYYHIQLGKENEFTTDLKKWGAPAYHVNKGEDLSRLMVNITKNVYHPFIQERK